MKTVRLAAAGAFILMAAVCAPQAASASDNSDVMTVINGAISSFNKGDAKTWSGYCTPSASIVSNTPPYQSSSCAQWWGQNVAANKANGMSNVNVTCAKPWQFMITGSNAYVTLPCTVSFEQKGKPVTAAGNVLTVALHKGASGWLMTGWSWSAH